VWVVKDDQSIELRPIVVARYDTESVDVSSGLRSGERHRHSRGAQAAGRAEGTAAATGLREMSAFNASTWALEHKSFVGFLMVLLSVAGLVSYQQLGRDEDPPFTIKVMVVRALWPGASAEDTARQVRTAWKRPCSRCSGLTTSPATASLARPR